MGTKICSKCGVEINDTAKFCPKCGNNVTATTSSSSNNGFDAAAAMNAGKEQLNNVMNSFMSTNKNGVNFLVRRYFLGFGDFIWLSIILWVVFQALEMTFGSKYGYYGSSRNGFGSFCAFMQVIAIIGLIASIGMNIYMRVIGMGEANVDEATNTSVATLKQRAYTKFNVDVEQTKEIEPIIIAGAGSSPSESLSGDILKSRKFWGYFRRFRSKDPIEAYRLGNDKIPRYMLIQTTLYAFTDTQLLVYSGNMDISTGIIYDEKTSEIFYKDINSVTQQDLLGKFKAGFFKSEYYTMNFLDLDVCGITKKASFDSRFANNSLKQSLAGMESLIREKKS